MSHERLMEMGGEPVGSEIFIKHVAMGKFVNGGFSLYPAGETLLATQEEPVPEVEKATKGTKGTKGHKKADATGDEKPSDPLADLEGL